MNAAAQLQTQAVAACNQRDWRRALNLATQVLEQAPDNAELHQLAGLAAMEMGQLQKALGHLRLAADLCPQRADYATRLAKALSMANLSTDAVVVADRVLALAPLTAQTLDTLGVIYTRADIHQRAADLFDRAVALAPNHPNYHYNLAKSLIFLGDMDAAERELETCVRLLPELWGAHLTLSQLRQQTATNNHLDRLLSMLPKSASDPIARMNLHLALAKEYEDLADYSHAFSHLVAGKSASQTIARAGGGSTRHYTPQHDKLLFDALIQTSSEPRPDIAGCPSMEPIFIIGMPRSGTTLVERILSSHPDVHAAGELKNFGLALKRISGSRTPYLIDVDTIARTRDINWQQVGEEYLNSTRPATGHTHHFIDKLPHNFLYVGAIANALPNAKIICLRRDPMDTCLSNFRQLFSMTSSNHDYSYDLLDIGRYYILFDRLMAHWKRTLPEHVLELEYETLVDRQEASTRQLLTFCGLPWHDACLHFEDNREPVTTASAAQVRAPIYRTAMKRWKRYETELTELRALLESAGINVSD